MPSILSVNNQNDVLTRIIKYIPAEIITIYTSIVAILTNVKVSDCKDMDKTDIITFKWIVISLIIITPVWKYFSVKDNPSPVGGSTIKAAIFHAVIATLSFCLYVYVDANNLLKCWIGENVINPRVGAAVLLFFSIALVPLLERLILKTPPVPDPPQ
ncbi:MAG: hypothetical protein ABI402_07780 [Ferruginibacter sp.]